MIQKCPKIAIGETSLISQGLSLRGKAPFFEEIDSSNYLENNENEQNGLLKAVEVPYIKSNINQEKSREILSKWFLNKTWALVESGDLPSPEVKPKVVSKSAKFLSIELSKMLSIRLARLLKKRLTKK